MKGKIERIGQIIELKRGQNKKGQEWILYGTHIQVDGKEYGLTGFSKTQLEEKIALISAGDIVEFETEEKDGYLNIKQDSAIKVVQEGAKSEEKIQQTQTLQPTMPMTRDEVVEETNRLTEKLLKKKEIDPVILVPAKIEIFKEIMIDCREEYRQRCKVANMNKFEARRV